VSRADAWSTRFHCIRQQARCATQQFSTTGGSTTEPNGVSELSLAPHRATVLTTKHSLAEIARKKPRAGVGCAPVSPALAAGLPLAVAHVAESPFELNKPDYLLWGALRSSFASSSTPAGCLLQLIHGLGEGARGAKSGCKKSNSHCGGFSI
jgi:hypothetical protein